MGLLALACAALALPSSALSGALRAAPHGHASVSGIVFDDYGLTGVQNLNPAKGQVDRGLAGITVNAYDSTNQVVATATTNATGHYKLNGLPVGPVRVEVEIPRQYSPSADRSSPGGTVAGARANTTSTLDSDERYLDDSSSPGGVNFGLEVPDEYSVAKPTLYMSDSWFGPTDDPTAKSNIGVEQVPYFAPNGATGGKMVASFAKIGTTGGLAVDEQTGDVFAAAYYKRSFGLLASGFYKGLTYPTGGIYEINPASGKVTLFADVNAGVDHHPPLEAKGGTQKEWDNDYSWPYVGHEGWGDIVTGPTSQNLYGVNLFNRSLYRFKIPPGNAQPTGPERPSRIAGISNPGCKGGDWVPSALGFDQATGKLYVGGVCNAASSQNPADLHAYVEQVNDPTGKPTFKVAFSFALNYNRLDNHSVRYPAGSGKTESLNSDWRPWPTLASLPKATYPQGPPDVNRPTRTTQYGTVDQNNESYPEFMGIAFDSRGNMLIGLRDLMIDVSNFFSPNQSSPISQGDLLKACVSAAGSWTLESGGKCGGASGFHPTVNGKPVKGSKAGVDHASFGPIGPGGGYFFDPNPAINESSPDKAKDRSDLPGPYMGGMVQIGGFPDVVSVQSFVNGNEGAFGGGLVWDNNSHGDYVRYTGDGVDPADPGGYAFGGGGSKSNGLGDLAAFTSLAPTQIGNRVWKDVHRNCTEVAGDPGIPGVVVNLVGASGATLATATTDAAGEYTFDIQAHTKYRVQIQPSQKPLSGLAPTCANKAGVDPRITSKGVLANGFDSAPVDALNPGQNNFMYDFGFVHPPITVTKHADRSTANPGQTVRYTITVRNHGSSATLGLKVCDDVPRGLAPVGSTKSRLKHGLVCFVPKQALGPNRTETFHVSFRVLRLPKCTVAVKNTAYATVNHGSRTTGSATIQDRCKKKPPPPVTG